MSCSAKESSLAEPATSVLHLSQQAAYHPEVSEEVKKRALMFGSECTTGYIDLLEHVLLVGGASCCGFSLAPSTCELFTRQTNIVFYSP